MIVEVVCELLEIRRSAREDALNTNSELLDRTPTLSSAELALLARHQEAESSDNPMSQARLSNDWFRGLESDSNIYLTTAVTQNPARVTAATAEACTRHFSSLDELLADLDFVHRSGRHAGMIKTNCLGRILSVDEMPGLRAGFTRNVKVYSSADRTVDQGCLPGRTYNETITLVLSIAMDGTVLPPMVIHANRGLGGDEDANWSLDEGRAHFDRLAASFSRLEERHQDMIRSTPRQRHLLDRITPQERSRRRRAPIFGPMSSGPSAADLEGRERRRVHLHASRERRAARVANEADLRAALNVQRITIANLKSFCRSHCLGTAGSRAELIARTRTQLELPQPPTTPSSPGRPAGEVFEPLATPLAQIESREDAELTPMPASPPRDDRNSPPSDSTPPTLTAASAAPSLDQIVEEEPQEPIARVGGHFADSDLQFWLRDYTSQTQPFQDATSLESNAPAAPLACSNTDQNEIDLLIRACDESTKKYKAYIDSLIALEPHTSTS
ncbi:uncharacterized protein MONBRDRAFT_9777 [Monosiga brevicollis MX1]|uniref:SAP domain-containing protein n=1 Tax=Monosiga brevicollis TaxID=81824 RepID=A9V471_MONBE|nr:uncharacterized protein MONBRDRAFT_9777 [Monosiga brevicollis MX1]EDQ87655.1 predicted protein [Monosiga brevicollis MX1]|eukprot:XP_001747575.1 hypothetical protein [Monosiga brevicollis MX1]